MSSDEAYVISEMRRLVCDLGVRITACQRAGQLSRAVHLSEARESILKAIHCPNASEKQLVLQSPDALPLDDGNTTA